MENDQKQDGSILITAAKAIGRKAGQLASMVGAETPAPTPKVSHRPGKLQKKNKQRVPRRQKKAQLRAAGAVSR